MRKGGWGSGLEPCLYDVVGGVCVGEWEGVGCACGGEEVGFEDFQVFFIIFILFLLESIE